jgi:plasmid stabilization system protein ParE
MAYNLRSTPEAELDIANAINHYDRINPDLADRFLNELYDAYDRITENPQYYSFISPDPHDKMRDLKLTSFPYVVVFEINDIEVVVISVMNTSREPML